MTTHVFTLLDAIPDGSFVLNKDRVVVFWNTRLEEWTGIQREQVIGMPIGRYFPHFDSAKYTARIQNLFDTGIPVIFSPYLHKYIIPIPLNADQFQIHKATATRISLPASQEFYALFTIQDVTELAQRLKDYRAMRDQAEKEIRERMMAEEALKHAKLNLENIFHAAMPLCVTLRNFEISQVNDAYCEFFGITKEEAVGKKCYAAHRSPACHTERCPLHKIFNGAEHVEYELAKTRADGSTLWCIVTARPYRDLHGELIGIVENFQDITKRKQAEEAIQEAKHAAEEANKSKSRFLANMSHELRTPLNSILGFSQMMQRNQHLPPEDHHRLKIIIHSGEHLLTLINQVLDLSKAESGKITLQETQVDVLALLHETAELFEFRAKEHGVSFRYAPQHNLPRFILADGVKLRQILINLLNNAFKFTHSGSITLRTRMEQSKSDSSHCRLVFEVCDTGTGIDTTEFPMLFEPFTQTASGQQHREGTGLGLAISRKFARMMRGDITVQSTVGQGSCFTCTVMVSLIKEADRAKLQTPRKIVSIQGRDPSHPTGYRMLIVDEHAQNRELLTQLFQPFGFDTREAQNGAEAVAIWESWQPRIIWMDLFMPVMDGFEAARQIRDAEMRRHAANSNPSESSRTIILALTASMFEQEEERASLAGCDGFLRKPYQESALLDMLARHTGLPVAYEVSPPDIPPRCPLSSEVGTNALSRQLKTLPTQILEQMKYAATTTDITLLSDLVSSAVAPVNAALADMLSQMLNNFEYMTILEAIDLAFLANADSAGIIADQHSLETL